MANSNQPTHQGRYVELPGGVIYDTGLGIELCRINVDDLHTFDALDVVKVITDALNAEWPK